MEASFDEGNAMFTILSSGLVLNFSTRRFVSRKCPKKCKGSPGQWIFVSRTLKRSKTSDDFTSNFSCTVRVRTVWQFLLPVEIYVSVLQEAESSVPKWLTPICFSSPSTVSSRESFFMVSAAFTKASTGRSRMNVH